MTHTAGEQLELVHTLREQYRWFTGDYLPVRTAEDIAKRLLELGWAKTPQTPAFDEAAWAAQELEDEQRAKEWNEYWDSLTPEGQARERASMDAYVAMSRELGD